MNDDHISNEISNLIISVSNYQKQLFLIRLNSNKT